MTRVVGVVLIAFGVLVAVPQIFTTYPYQPLIALGVAFLVAGGLLICDHEAKGTS